MIFGNRNSNQRGGGGGGGGGGFPVRLIIGVVIALVAVVGYYSKTETNPVTGESQRVAMGSEQEMKLGLQAAPQMAQEMGGAVDPRTNKDAALIERIGQRLAYETEATKSEYAKAKNFHFYLLNDTQTINAFALPGGQIFMTRALFDRLENEAQVAGVLGHEVGHVIHRHGAEHMAKGQFGQMLVTAVAVGASDDRGGGNMAAMAANMANGMLQLKYSRTDELESDAYGLRLLIDLGYDPAEMLGVMKVLADASKGGSTPDMLKTHPDPAARIDQIKQILEKYKTELAGKKLTKGAPLR